MRHGHASSDTGPRFLARPPLYELQHVGAIGKNKQNRKTERKFAMKTMQDPLKPPPQPMPAAADPLPPGEYAALIGLDWGDAKHSVALCARGSHLVETLDIEHSPESIHAWFDSLAGRFGGQPVAVAVEASKGAVVAAMAEHPWLKIYPVHPATSRRFSTAFTPSGAKDDVPDARILLEILRSHRDRLRLLVAHDPQTSRLGLLNEARRTMVDRRTRLSNQLTSLLKGYFPQAIELTGDTRYSELALAFLERWPDLDALRRSRPQSVRGFYHTHNVRRPELVARRLELIRTARPLTTDRGLCEVGKIEMRALVAEIRLVRKHIAAAERTMAEAFASHPDAALFAGLPGAGAAMAPRLSVLFGIDRERWQSAGEMQTYYGIAPVVERSGRKTWVHWRWNAPVFARQTLVEWAGISVKYSAWAKAYYRQCKERGKGHSAIVRSLAFKWLRILWRCWRDRTPYNENRYLASLEKRNPPLFALIQKT
jgi:hypothetical protein